MSLRERYLGILRRIAPAGAAVLLGAAVPGVAKEHPETQQPAAVDRVSERLAAIRDAVSALAEEAGRIDKPGAAGSQLAWGNWWHNWGWYRPWRGWGWPNWRNWPNWHNWGNWWHNW